MPKEPQLRTERLVLRRWRSTDVEPCATMNADPVVMEHFPAPLTSTDSAAFVARMEASFDSFGYGLWAVELPGEASFVGCVGLMAVDIDAAFAPSIEVGWRLAQPFWGLGIATEAAEAAISFAFDELQLPALVAYTAERNLRSRRVMARLRMLRDPAEDFIHPQLPRDHPLARHVLYRTDRQRWHAATGG